MGEFLIRYLLCFINSFITFWCFCYITKNRLHIVKLVINTILYAFISYYLTFLLDINNNILSFNILIIINILWLKILFHQNIIYIMVYSFFCDAIMSICFLACSFLFIELFQISWNEITTFSVVGSIVGLLFQFVYFLVIYNLLKSMKQLLDPILMNKDKYYLLFVLFPSLAFNLLFDFFHRKIPATHLLAIYISLTIMFIFTFLFFKQLVKIERENNLQKNIIQNIKYTEDYLKTMLYNQKELKKIKHELLNQSIIMKEMLNNGQYDRLLQYLDQFHDGVKTRNLTCQSGNIYIDALINHKINKNSEIKFDIKISELEEVLFIDDFVFCSLLGIIFDNAIEAVEKVTNKWISFHCILKGNSILIRIKNPINNISDLKSKKEKSSDHGLGLEILRTTVQSYGGSLKIEQIDNIFDVCILINNKKSEI